MACPHPVTLNITEDTPPPRPSTNFGRSPFGGACPPPGEVHRYEFTVHALRELDDGVSNALAGYMVNANSLGSASITAVYNR